VLEQQERGDEVAAEDQEEVDAEEAAAGCADAGVVEEHRPHSHGPQAV
jgi:hypothetical protein